MTILLSDVISEFGGSGTIPINMRAYLKLGAFAGWYGGVAEHANNSAIPVSGTVTLSDFVSPANRDFVSDSYTDGLAAWVSFPNYQSAFGYATTNGLIAAGLTNLTAMGSAGSRTVMGKSTYGATGQTATIIGVYDYDNNGSTGCIVQMSGDQRRSGWGGTGTVGGTSGAAPTNILVVGSTVLSFGSSSVPGGTYDVTYNLTTWTWPGSTFNLDGSGTFTFSISIF